MGGELGLPGKEAGPRPEGEFQPAPRPRGRGALCVEAGRTEPLKSLCEESWGTRPQGAQLELCEARGPGLCLWVPYSQGSQLAPTREQKVSCSFGNTRMEGDRLLLARWRRGEVADRGESL